MPQMIFLLSVIGYLCILIIYKWAMWKANMSGVSSNSRKSLVLFLWCSREEPAAINQSHDKIFK